MPNAKIVPILVQGSEPAVVSAIAGALKVLAADNNEKSIILVSSNASVSPDKAQARSMAENFAAALSAADSHAFSAELSAGRITACGGAIVAALFESGLLEGKSFSALSQLKSAKAEDECIVYYGAFATF
jgi:AmmeMemoRadiSam system protein B